MSIESDNKELRRRFWSEAFHAIDEMVDRYISQDWLDHDAAPEQPQGADGYKWLLHRLKAGFPDVCFLPAEQIAEGDKIVTPWTIQGTHTQRYRGLEPTGKRITVSGIQIDRLKDGKVVESWNHSSSEGIYIQLTGKAAP
jgi:predicted ester cyclase